MPAKSLTHSAKNAQFGNHKNSQNCALYGTKTKSHKLSVATQIALWLFVVIVGLVFAMPRNCIVQTNIDAAGEITTIATIDDLNNFATSVNSGTTYSGITVTVTAKTLTISSTWTPIGTSDNKFQGTFDGNMCEFVLNNAVNPIFGYIENATVKNVKTSGTAGADSTSLGNSGSGLRSSTARSNIVYNATASTIANCLNAASLCQNYMLNNYSAGVVYSATDTTITNCANVATIKCDNGGDSPTGAEVAGIVAFAGGASIISNCYNSGELYADSGDSPGANGIGGNGTNTTVTNCYNIGTLSFDNFSYGVCTNFSLAHNLFSVGNTKNRSTGTFYDALTTTEAALFQTEANISTYTNGTSTYTWDAGYPWDFENVWTFIEGENNDYPVLRVFYENIKKTFTTTFNVEFNNAANTAQILLYLFRYDDNGGYAEFYSYYFDGSETTQTATAELSKKVEYEVLICKPYSWNFSVTGSNITGGTLKNNKYTFTTSSDDGVIEITTTGGTLINNYIVV